ncbi:MAG TPA: RluA family pseudouridine synthase, partial [Usitatibacter sp.]|nr:RluA family pseudouridine synthase [Usitatibacter sp.]
DGRVTVDGERILDPAERVPPGAAVVVDERAPKVDRGPLAKEAIVFADRDLAVVDKPAGMLTVADEAGNRDTLAEYTRTLLRRIEKSGGDPGLGIVHRLDRDTSGLVLFTRTAEAKRKLAVQFRDHTIERIYHAIAQGSVPEAKIESDLVMDRGDGLRGSHGHYRRAKGAAPSDAKHSITFVKPIEALRGATLIECKLATGRQHQIRIHLSEMGHPLLGERVYIRDYEGPKIEAPRVMLHARTLGFMHPRNGKRMSFEREAPAEFLETAASLRR